MGISSYRILHKSALALKNNLAVRDSLLLAALVTAYILAVYGIHAFFGIRDKVILHFYYDGFTRLVIVASGIFILLHIRKKSYHQFLRPHYLVGVLSIFLLAPLFASAFASFKQTIPLMHGFSWDVSLMRLDYNLHFGHHPWRLMQSILDYPWIVRGIDFLYMLWFAVFVVFCLWMASSQRRHLRLCFFISAILIWSLLGSGLATVFSSAGPCYYSQVVPAGDNPFAPLMGKLSAIYSHSPLWAIENQYRLWLALENGYWLPFGGISAMPSVHLAMATLFALVAFDARKWIGMFFVGYAAIIQIGAIILGWHYAVDGYAGIILTCFIWYAAKRLINWYAHLGVD